MFCFVVVVFLLFVQNILFVTTNRIAIFLQCNLFSIHIALLHLNTLSCLGGREVTLRTSVREVPCSVPVSGKNFYVCFFVVVLLCFDVLSKKHYLHTILFCNGNLLSILNILQNVWPIISVLRYRTSIFMKFAILQAKEMLEEGHTTNKLDYVSSSRALWLFQERLCVHCLEILARALSYLQTQFCRNSWKYYHVVTL